MADNDQVQEGEFEVEAREMGWVPKEDWDGEEEKWVDAKTFVDRGQHIMPIMRANNKRLKQDLLTRDKEIASLKQSVEAANKAIKALNKHYTEATAHAVEEAKKELREQLKQAREVGDVDAELEVQEKLDELKERQKEAKAETKEEDTNPKQPAQAQWFQDWVKENPWFGNDKNQDDKKRTRAINRIAEDLRDDGDTTEGRDFLDKCLKMLEKQEGKSGQQGKTPSKVEGGNAGGRTTGGRPFDRLPKEAKEACHSDNEYFVGPGKKFKTVKEWEDEFANYFSEE